jgi:hypothetical protein
MKTHTRLALLCVLLAPACSENRPIVVDDGTAGGSPSGVAGFGGPSGEAGTGGSPASATGAAGTAGAAGAGLSFLGTGGTVVPDNPPPGCDVRPLFFGPNSRYKCSETAICHDPNGGAANLSLATADWQNHLIGVVPKGGGTVPSICARDPMFKNMPYIIKGNPNGDGILLRKLMGPLCNYGLEMGVQMPLIGNPLSAADLACAKQWTTALAALP